MPPSFLTAAFPAATEAEWRQLAEKALGGRAVEALISHTEDGVPYGPIHAGDRPVQRTTRSGKGAWRAVQRVDDQDAVRAGIQALDDLEGGAEGLSLVVEGAPSGHGFGLQATESAIGAALSPVILDIVPLRVEPHAGSGETVARVLRLGAARGLEPEWIHIDHGFDPVGLGAAAGMFPAGGGAGLRGEVGDHARQALESGGPGRFVEADGRVWHEAGGSEAQELGPVLATALFYLRAMEGIGVEQAASRIGFTLAADQRQFVVMAKLRAMRLLWDRLLGLCGVEAGKAPMRLHVETSFRMMSAQDPHTNILRTTIAAFAAATGGADSIAVLPYTLANGLPDAKARRLARNLQTILREESGLGHVADPAAGSGGIEALTRGIAAAAWAEFQRIEREGGIVASLLTGALKGRIDAMRRAREAALADGRLVAIGATRYPLSQEREIGVLAARAAGQAGPEAALTPSRLTEAAEARR